MTKTIDRWFVALFAFCFAITAGLVVLGKVDKDALGVYLPALFAWLANPPKLVGAVEPPVAVVADTAIVVTPEDKETKK